MTNLINPLPLVAEPPPLRMDEAGVARIGRTRVPLDLVVEQYENGMSPEGIVRAFDALELGDVYAVIAYYLRHRNAVQAYLRQREEDAQELQAKIESVRPSLSRQKLLACRAMGKNADAPTGE